MSKELSLDELILCALFSAGLNSMEYGKLEEKSQIIKMYNQEPTKNFRTFLDFDRLVERINDIKTGEYVLHVPKELKEKENISSLINQGNAEVVEEVDLEDMFCTFLTDKADEDVSKDLLEFYLNKEYFGNKDVVTNRLMHSLQVMLGTGLACKSLNVSLDETFTCMIISAFHDIGHVPFAHVMEQIIKTFTSDFSHEKNGRKVLEKIVHDSEEKMVDEITRYFQGDAKVIKDSINKKAQIIESGISEHSRTNSKKRKNGMHLQLTRALDKIFYFASDAHDLTTVPQNLTKKQTDKQNEESDSNDMISKAYEEEQDNKKHMEFIQALKDKNFGRVATIASSSISAIPAKNEDNEDMIYYDVDEKIWKTIIEQTKAVHHEYDFGDLRDKMEKLSVIVFAKITASKYHNSKKSLADALDEAIDEITCMSEKEAYDYCRNFINSTSTRLQEGKTGDNDLIQSIKKQINDKDNMTHSETVKLFKNTFALSEDELTIMEELRKTKEGLEEK